MLDDGDVEAGGGERLGYAAGGRVQRGQKWVPL
jgi:hypothetical protein